MLLVVEAAGEFGVSPPVRSARSGGSVRPLFPVAAQKAGVRRGGVACPRQSSVFDAVCAGPSAKVAVMTSISRTQGGATVLMPCIPTAESSKGATAGTGASGSGGAL